MQYQVFIQSQPDRKFVASIVGMPDMTAGGKTEEEAIAKVKSALETRLATGKFVSIEVTPNLSAPDTIPPPKTAGIFAEDASFDDFMEKLARIRQEANAVTDGSRFTRRLDRHRSS